MAEDVFTEESKIHRKKINYIVSLVGIILTIYGNLDIDRSRALGIVCWISPKKFFFVTNFTLLLSTVSFVLSGATYGMNSSRKVKMFASYVLSCVVSAEVIICCVFWPIFWYNPRLVFTSSSLSGLHKIGLFSNLCAHTFPCVLLFMLYVLDEIDAPPNIIGLGLYTGAVSLILVLFRVIYKRWRYMILNIIQGKVLLFLPLLMLFVGSITLHGLYQLKKKARKSRLFKSYIERCIFCRCYKEKRNIEREVRMM